MLRPAFNGLILYGTQTDSIGDDHQLVPWIVAEAKRLGYRAIVLGVRDPKSNAELSAAAALINQYAGDPSAFAVAVCIGNEGILRGEYAIADLDNARTTLLSQIGTIELPIVTSEDLARYTAVPQLKAWGSFLFPIIVPHWNMPNLGPADAAAWVRQAGAALADNAQATVFVKEAGFPSGGAAQYTPETQRQFFAAYLGASPYADSTQVSGVFTAYNSVLEAFDQYWKSNPDFTTWGLLAADRTPKPVYKTFLAFTNQPLVAAADVVRATHVSELRARIDALRIRAGLSAFAWTDATITAHSTRVRAVHIAEMQTALGQTYVARSLSLPQFTSIAAGQSVKASHVTELRNGVLAIE
jgi:exo-beta-1,3-glucanase (GH17 family)